MDCIPRFMLHLPDHRPGVRRRVRADRRGLPEPMSPGGRWFIRERVRDAIIPAGSSRRGSANPLAEPSESAHTEPMLATSPESSP